MTKILLIEDDEAILLMAQRTLKFLGFEATFCGDAHRALKAFKENDFDLVITDFGIPGPGGLPMIAKMRQIKPDQPIIVMSGSDLDNDDFQKAKEKFDPLFTLAKPFNLDDFSNLVKAALNSE